MNSADSDLWRRHAIYLLSWKQFDTAIQLVAAQLRSAGEEADCILGISRGGLVPAVALSNALDIPAFHAIAVGRNLGSGQYLDKQPPRVLWRGNLDAMRGQRVLAVDDVTGSGETLRHVRGHALSAGAASVRTAVIASMRRGAGAADFAAVELDDWVVFPWENSGLPVGARTRPVIMPEAGGEKNR